MGKVEKPLEDQVNDVAAVFDDLIAELVCILVERSSQRPKYVALLEKSLTNQVRTDELSNRLARIKLLNKVIKAYTKEIA